MSLVVLREPPINAAVKVAGGLEVGTWFLDSEENISVVLQDDRTLERRIVNFCRTSRPFIAQNPVHNFRVGKILTPGTIVQIVQFDTVGGGENE